jgi:lysylphosphatidylglycerol synthetase-like protein (DUF2156 family)
VCVCVCVCVVCVCVSVCMWCLCVCQCVCVVFVCVSVRVCVCVCVYPHTRYSKETLLKFTAVGYFDAIVFLISFLICLFGLFYFMSLRILTLRSESVSQSKNGYSCQHHTNKYTLNKSENQLLRKNLTPHFKNSHGY